MKISYLTEAYFAPISKEREARAAGIQRKELTDDELEDRAIANSEKARYQLIQDKIDLLVREFFTNKSLISYTNIFMPGDLGSEWDLLGRKGILVNSVETETKTIHCSVFLGYFHSRKDPDVNNIYKGILGINADLYTKYQNDYNAAKAGLCDKPIKKLKAEAVKKLKSCRECDKIVYQRIAEYNFVIDNICVNSDNSLRIKIANAPNSQKNIENVTKLLVNVIDFLPHRGNDCTELTVIYDDYHPEDNPVPIIDLTDVVNKDDFRMITSVILKLFMFQKLEYSYPVIGENQKKANIASRFRHSDLLYTCKPLFKQRFGVLFKDKKNCDKTYNDILQEYLKIYKSSNCSDIKVKDIKAIISRNTIRNNQSVFRVDTKTGNLSFDASNSKIALSKIWCEFSFNGGIEGRVSWNYDYSKFSYAVSITANDAFAKSVNVNNSYVKEKVDYYNNGYGVDNMTWKHDWTTGIDEPNKAFIAMMNDRLAENVIKYDFLKFLTGSVNNNRFDKNIFKEYYGHSQDDALDFSEINNMIGFDSDFDSLSMKNMNSIIRLFHKNIRAIQDYFDENRVQIAENNFKF